MQRIQGETEMEEMETQREVDMEIKWDSGGNVRKEEDFIMEVIADPSADLIDGEPDSFVIKELDIDDVTDRKLEFVSESTRGAELEVITNDIEKIRQKLKPMSPKTHKTSGTPSQKEYELQRENLKLSSEKLELCFQLEQANNDLPRLKDQVADLKEMYNVLKKEKAEVEKKLGHVRGAGRSGKTVPELEKTIGLMKRVVDRVQRENETLKKTPAALSQEQLTALERKHEKLKNDYEKLKRNTETQLSSRLETKTKGVEKIVMENEHLRKEIKRETEATERLRMAKTSLEMTNEKLEAELEEARQQLVAAQSRVIPEGVESKTWKATVVTRMFESKMKALEQDISQKNSSLSELRLQLREASEREEKAQRVASQLQEQVKLLNNFPTTANTESGLAKEFQSTRLTNNQLEREKEELVQKCSDYTKKYETTSARPGYEELQALLKATGEEKKHLQAEVKKMKMELENFDPTFFEEIEDLKFNYNLEVKKNIVLEEQLKKVCEQFGVAAADIPDVSIS